MKQVTDTSKAILWWNGLNEDEQIKLTQKHFVGIPLNTLMDKSIEAMYIYENPQTTDTGNTVSGEWEVNETGGVFEPFQILCNGKEIAVCKWGIKSKYPETFEEVKANAQRIVNCVNNFDSLVSALKNMCEWHEKQATWDKGDNGYYAAKQVLNQINQL